MQFRHRDGGVGSYYHQTSTEKKLNVLFVGSMTMVEKLCISNLFRSKWQAQQGKRGCHVRRASGGISKLESRASRAVDVAGPL
jgi:hypothetical protein